jgi:hypothetical protein
VHGRKAARTDPQKKKENGRNPAHKGFNRSAVQRFRGSKVQRFRVDEIVKSQK